jgi:hypothetical protein
VNGTNLGWSDETVLKYPGANITLKDGTELHPESDVIPAQNRTYAKYGYNLIANPGFEEV